MAFPIELEIVVNRLRGLLKNLGDYKLEINQHPRTHRFFLYIEKKIHDRPCYINMRFPTEDDAIVVMAIVDAFDRLQLRMEGKAPPLVTDIAKGHA